MGGTGEVMHEDAVTTHKHLSKVLPSGLSAQGPVRLVLGHDID